jgi:hypothetical protein
MNRKPADALEPVAGIAFTAAGYLAAGLWPALAIAGVVVLYLAQRASRGPFLGHLQSVRLRSGDLVVARLPAGLGLDQFAAAEARLRRELPPEIGVIAIPDTMDIAKLDMRALHDATLKRTAS